jgi:hypothetical protein
MVLSKSIRLSMIAIMHCSILLIDAMLLLEKRFENGSAKQNSVFSLLRSNLLPLGEKLPFLVSPLRRLLDFPGRIKSSLEKVMGI